MLNWWLSTAVSSAVLVGFQPAIVHAQSDSPGRDLGAEVRSLFAVKCAGCHGPDLAKPKGRFGDVLDLRKMAANPEMVIPYQPDQSELWALVYHNEMPPADSPQGELTTSQKEVVRSWIAAGAPDVFAHTFETPEGPEPISREIPRITAAQRMIRWLGKFHLLMLHFPVALILAAAFAEAWAMWRRNPIPSDTVRFCLALGAITAIPTAGLGWLFAASGNGIGSPQLLNAHRWLGTTTALCLVLAAIASEHDARQKQRHPVTRLLLAVGVAFLSLTAHLGGLLSRGEDFFAY
ncbi:c-type cytochrome domain-containing protein [Zavarzinella formosa]|uniref:c-type cytochrome domain-containing protein n=1 Tax=Zavarzinella formosa TaxID=360055 RepID=UPI0002D6D4CC|nr:c-type cytochrome domain-containing protein [Zavarzinella formosa]